MSTPIEFPGLSLVERDAKGYRLSATLVRLLDEEGDEAEACQSREARQEQHGW